MKPEYIEVGAGVRYWEDTYVNGAEDENGTHGRSELRWDDWGGDGMTDTKQLKYAAKAAGYEVVRIADDCKALMLYGVQEPWNPRTDNGQAFELAMLVDITVRRIDPYVYAIGKTQHQARFDNSEAMMSAAREAVVLAAAEIGKSMK